MVAKVAVLTVALLALMAASAFAAPGLSVSMLEQDSTQNGSAAPGPINALAGDTIVYSIVVTNTGDQALALNASDATCTNVAGPAVGPGGNPSLLVGNQLSPGGVAQFNCVHVLTASDAPVFDNQATVIGLPASGPPLTQGASALAAVVVPNSSFSLTTAQSRGAGGPFVTTPISAAVGDTIDYQITATDTGNTSLTFTDITDANCGTIFGGPGAPAVSPGAGTSWTCKHTVTAADAAVPGSTYVDGAAATAAPPAGEGSGATVTSNTAVANTLNPAYTVTKQQSLAGAGPFATSDLVAQPGQIVYSMINVQNTGNATEDVAQVTDAGCDTLTSSGATSLLPGGSSAAASCASTRSPPPTRRRQPTATARSRSCHWTAFPAHRSRERPTRRPSTSPRTPSP